MLKAKLSQGSALLTALFIMTLVAIVATAMSLKVQMDIYRTRLVITHDTLYLASQAVTFWALNELGNENNHFGKLASDGSVAAYPKTMQSIQKGVTLSGGLYDLQGLFNLNNLVDKKGMLGFINLLSKSGAQMTNADKVDLVESVKNWISPYDPSTGKDAYISYYQSQKPPYYPSHQLMQSKSEFRLIKDVSADLYKSLETLITVLPKSTPININTASKEVLMSLGPGLSEQKLSVLLVNRANQEILKLQDINDLLTALGIPADQLTTESEYFLNVANVSNDEAHLIIFTLLQRSRDKNKKLLVNVVRQSINGF